MMTQPDPFHWKQFWYFVAERQRVWHRRFIEEADKPWTDDAVLQSTKFTNVYRELDPGTEYVIDAIIDADASRSTKAFNVLFYRVVGRIETHAHLGLLDPDAFNAACVDAAMREVPSVKGKPIFTGAYLVHPYGFMGGKDKVDNIVRLFTIIASSWNETWKRMDEAASSEVAYDALRGIKGIGDFLAFQTIVDLRYPGNYNDSVLPFTNDDWAKAGPGAIRGLGYVFGEHANELELMQFLRDNQEQGFQDAGVEFPTWVREGVPQRVSLANIQNCLCEYHKYAKISDGTGQGRAAYDGRGKGPQQSLDLS